MRWYIIRTLLHKEFLRHLANRGGIALVLLLVVAALLLSAFGGGESQAVSAVGGVKRCYIEYWQDDPWIDHLQAHLPPELEDRVRFRMGQSARTDGQGSIVYEQNAGGIQLRPQRDGGYQVWIWHPGKDTSSIAPFEAWFWQETHKYWQGRAAEALADVAPAMRRQVQTPDLTTRRFEIAGGLDPRSGIATALVIFGLFFVCVYLLPSLTCEERERGVLLAQALSPATASEILGAKFLFYPVLGLALAVLLAGTYNPGVLLRPFFWLAMLVAVWGSMGVGLTIASLARTQRAASMGAMCYMFAIALLLFICQQVNIKGLPYLALEYHCPRMIHAVLGDALRWYHWGNLAATAVLAGLWTAVATYLFRQRGWQS